MRGGNDNKKSKEAIYRLSSFIRIINAFHENRLQLLCQARELKGMGELNLRV